MADLRPRAPRERVDPWATERRASIRSRASGGGEPLVGVTMVVVTLSLLVLALAPVAGSPSLGSVRTGSRETPNARDVRAVTPGSVGGMSSRAAHAPKGGVGNAHVVRPRRARGKDAAGGAALSRSFSPMAHVVGSTTSPPVYETGYVAATVGVGTNPNGVAYDSGNGDVYVANFGSNTVSVISGTTVVATVGVGIGPLAVGYDSGNGEVYVANLDSNTVSVISGTTVVATVNVGTSPDGVAYDSGNGDVYVANFGTTTVSVISGTTVVATVGVGPRPIGVGYDSGDGDVYVANNGGDTVSVISGTTVVATVGVGTNPVFVGYDSGNGDVYVANENSNTVSVISGTTVVATVGVGTHPNGVAYDSGNGDVYVANSGSDNVSVISGTTVVATVGVGSEPLGVGYDSGDGDVYVTNYGSNTVSVISTLLNVGALDGNLVHVTQSVMATVTPGTGPNGMAYDSGNGEVYVANTVSNNVSVISGTTVVGTVNVGTNPLGVGYDSGNGDVYVVNYGSNNVSVISGTTVVATVNVGTNPLGVGYDSGNGDVYVANSGSDNVSVISGTTVVGTVNVGTFPYGIGYDSGNGEVYVANEGSGSVSVISGTTVVATVGVGIGPLAVGYDSGNGEVYVANYGSNDVSVISGTTVVGTVNIGSSPDGTAYDSGNGGVYVANYGSNDVSVISGTTVVATVNVGTSPDGVAYDSGNGEVYVANYGSSNVSVISPKVRTISAPTLTLDVGQTLQLSASAILGNPGVVGTSANVTPGVGLQCTALAATWTSVGMMCLASTPGTYTVTLTVTDALGNSVWTSVTVTVYSDPTVSVPVPTRTAADVGQTVYFSTSAMGGTGIYASYAWSAPSGLGCSASTTNTLACVPTAPVAGGTVRVNVTDTNNFTSSTVGASYTVSADPTIGEPVASRSTLDVGETTNLTVTGTNGTGLPSTYVWNGLPAGCVSADSEKVVCTPTGSGSFSVSVTMTDSNGYTVTSPALLLEVSSALSVPGLTASVTSLDVGQAVTFTVSVFGGSFPYSYQWTGLPSGCSGGDVATVTCSPSSPGNLSVTVVVTDASGVTRTSNAMKVVVSPRLSPGSLTVSPGNLDVGEATNLTVTAEGGSGVLSYQWLGLPGGCVSADRATVVCTPTGAGTAWVSVMVTDGNGAEVTVGPVAVETSPALVPPTVEASETTVEAGGSVTFTVNVSGGTAPLSYSWRGLPPGCVSANVATRTCALTTTGTYTVSVTVTDAVGVRASSAGVSVTVTKASAVVTGLSNGLDWGILGVAVVALILAALGVVLRGRRQGGKGDHGQDLSGQGTPASSPSGPTPAGGPGQNDHRGSSGPGPDTGNHVEESAQEPAEG